MASHEGGYMECARAINRSIDAIRKNPASRNDAATAAEARFGEAERHLRRMEAALQTLEGSERTSREQAVSRCKQDFQSLKTELNRALNDADNAELTGLSGGGRGGGGRIGGGGYQPPTSGDGGWGGPSSAPPTSGMRGTELLEESRRIIGETEEIGDQVMGDMENQRHQLLSEHEKVLETRGFISDARQTLSTMGWRELQHKAMLVAIIIILFVSICLVLWFRFINKPKDR
eukprot:CAMPEP_0205903680 /NCGR_PEP_ID=MMETSP1325-20131115/250_1 /ASSEMBLY_ACC=CAM_ASM_000708 /TAXON_ID=236786 /ORGANISM="Florenciella sp., Strain RCC1007" /LENGTH=231 /DNA_ID=CAMNT_0053269353 /DNA_START=63 /DNA_END=758 /DNA_ORIENTATION=+